MKSLLIIVQCFTILSVSLGTRMFYNIEEAEELFSNFVEEYNRTYSSAREVIQRFVNFKNNLLEINQLNAVQGEPAYGITNFADMSSEELDRMQMKPLDQVTQGKQCPEGVVPENVTPPSSLDYRNENIFGPIKDQGIYGTCGAFSTIGVVEAKYAMKHGQIIDLSEQQLVDCMSGNTEKGINMYIAMQYIVDNGVMLAKDYPYVGPQQNCKFNPNSELVRLEKCEQYNMEGNEEGLTKLLVEKGPLAFSLYADTLYHITPGLIVKNCPRKDITHAAVLVGYGTAGDGTPYWIVRNSWGITWGDNGYMRLRKGKNECNMMSYPFTSAEAA